MKFVFFSVSENGENGLSDEGADGAMPQNFWARTAPVHAACITLVKFSGNEHVHSGRNFRGVFL